MVRLYANENFPLPVVVALRAMGHDALTTQDAGKSDQEIPDDEVLSFAVEERRIVLTLNRRDFIRLHRSQPKHYGIIVCTFDADFPGQAQRIHTALSEAGNMTERLVIVYRPG